MSLLTILERLHQKECLSTVDLALAKHLLPGGSEAAAATVCHLSKAVRSGHLCISKEEPSIQDLWGEGAEEVRPLIQSGFEEIPADHPAFCKNEGLLYFKRYWDEETKFLNCFTRLLSDHSNLSIDIDKIRKELEGYQSKLLPEQQEAILQSCQKNLAIICGGPGTGKTYTAGILLRLLAQQLPPTSKIALAAPTGKAAANLQASLSKALLGHPWCDSLTATTLHALLAINKYRSEPKRLTADIVIIDECSMIDAGLMHHLFAALKKGSRLILLGDPNQLPPVEAGSFFGDLIAALEGTPFQAAMLKKCMRTESQSIMELASAVNRGDVNRTSEFPLISLEENRRFMQQFCKKYLDRYSADPQSISKFRILSPLRRGLFGVDNLNAQFLREATSQMKGRGPFAFPILIVGNDPQLELYNGELGILIRQGPLNDEAIGKEDYALISGRRIPMLLLPPFEYSYCLSVHKSQGSEFEEVILLMPPGAEKFGRKVLYTGITRAKSKLSLFGSQQTISQVVMRNINRLSGLKSRLLLKK